MRIFWKYVPPTLLTLGNLLIGVCLCVAVAWGGASTPGTLFVSLFAVALLLDGLDGWCARRLRAVSRFGRWLDALADGFSFGLLPALLLAVAGGALAVVGAVYLVAAVIRLVRFAAQRHAGPAFRGLPVPAAAVVIVLLHYVLQGGGQVTGPASDVLMAVVVAALLVLMLSPARVPHPVRVLWG